MTKAILTRQGNKYSVCVKGHATGRPDVCAGVSTLAVTLENWLRTAGDRIIKTRYSVIEPGLVEIGFIGSDGAEAKTAFDMICIGFMGLELGAPDAIKVKINEEK